MMTTAHELLYIDVDDVFANTSCLFQKYDGSSMSCGSSSSSRSSKSSKCSIGYENGSTTAGRTFRMSQDCSDIDKESSPRYTKDTLTERRNSVRSYKKFSRRPHDAPLDTSQYEQRHITKCEMCAPPLESQQTRYQSRFLTQTACSSCSDTNGNKRHASISISPAYRQGSWKMRLRAERNTDIDLSPLLDVLERIDRIDTSMGIPLSAYERPDPNNLNDNHTSGYKEDGARNINISRMEYNKPNSFDKDMNICPIDNHDKHTPKDFNRNVTDVCNNRTKEIDIYDRKSKQSIPYVDTDNATHDSITDEVNSNLNTKTNSTKVITTKTECNTEDTEDNITSNNTSSIQDEDDKKETKSIESDVEFENLFKEAQSFTKQIHHNAPIRGEGSSSLLYQKGRRRSSVASNKAHSKHKADYKRNDPSERLEKGYSSSAMSTEDSTSNSLNKHTLDTDIEHFHRPSKRISKRRLSKGQLELRMRAEIKNMNTHISTKQDENQGYSKRDIQVERMSSTDSDLTGPNSLPLVYTASMSHGDKLRESHGPEYSQSDRGFAERSSKYLKRRSVSKLNENQNKEVGEDLHNHGENRSTSDYKQEKSDSDMPLIHIENIPCSYEEFNNDLEKQSEFEDNKRSSIRPEESTIDFTSSTDETLSEIHKSSNNRRGSVSKMKLFWEQQLGSASKARQDTGKEELESESGKDTKGHIEVDDSTHGKKGVANKSNTVNNICSGNIKDQPKNSCEARKHSGPLSDEDETFCMIQNKLRDLPRTSTRKNLKRMSITNSTESESRFVNENIQNGQKKTVESYALKQRATASTESATDEDERFRRIQSKLMSRQILRRKSILKNKDVTSSFLNEFLTAPASMTRYTDSESGCSSPPVINQSQLSKRRVSFQQTYVSSSSSSSSVSSDSSCDDDEEVAELGTNCKMDMVVAGTDKPSEINGNVTFGEQREVNAVKENAENEHLSWRNKCGNTRETGDNTTLDSVCKDSLGEDKPKTNDKHTVASNNGNENVKTQKRNMPYQSKREMLVDNNVKYNSNNKKPSVSRDANTPCINSKASNTNVKQNQDRLMQDTSESDQKANAKSKSKTDKDSAIPNADNNQESVQVKLYTCEGRNDKSEGNILDDTFETLSKSLNKEESVPRRRRRAKLFSVAGEEAEPDETTHLLSVPVVLDSSDSSDVELSWRTRGYNADFYMSRKSVTGAELIQKFREVVRRKKSKDGTRVTK